MVSKAQAEAIARYHEKTYKHITLKLRLGEDDDMIKSHEEAQREGITSREWLRELFDNQK